MAIKFTWILISALVGGIIGFLSTIITLRVQKNKKRKEIKSTVNSLLKNTVIKSLDKFEGEVELVKEFIDDYNHSQITLNVHPELTSYHLKKFDLIELGYAYKDKFHHLIIVMSILDYLSERTPVKRQEVWLHYVSNHLAEHRDAFRSKWPTDYDHIMNCPAVEATRQRDKDNLDLIVESIGELRTSINELTS